MVGIVRWKARQFSVIFIAAAAAAAATIAGVNLNLVGLIRHFSCDCISPLWYLRVLWLVDLFAQNMPDPFPLCLRTTLIVNITADFHCRWITISASTVAMRLIILPTLIVQLQKTAKIGQLFRKCMFRQLLTLLVFKCLVCIGLLVPTEYPIPQTSVVLSFIKLFLNLRIHIAFTNW